MSFLTLVWQTLFENESSEFKSVKIILKVDLESHSADVEGFV